MNKRIAAIDVLRGVTIFMMVLSSVMAWNANIPAFMYHCQVPPPDFVFNPDIKGITWVDLVFPFFIFSMGASMPFSLGRKLSHGEPMWKVSLGIVKRWLILAAFGLVLGNAGLIASWGADPAKDGVRLAIWLAMFVALVRVKDGPRIKGWMINLCGGVMLIAMLLVEKHAFDVSFGFGKNNIIIMVLSSLALLGGFLWLATRKSMIARFVVLVAVCALKEVDWQFHCLGFLNVPESIYWLFNWRYAQYLVLTLVGMTVGDLLMKATDNNAALCADSKDWKSIVAAVICALIIPAMLWAFYTRHIWAALDITAISAIVFLYLTRGDRTVWITIARMGFALLALGIVFDPIDGGITKDHCNLSYMLSTGGMACLLTSFLLWLETRLSLAGRRLHGPFAMTGQNPMIAYTISAFVILPLWGLVMGAIPGANEWFDSLTAGRPVAGVLRGVFFTSLMMAGTCFFTKRKLFWRS